MQHYDGTSTSVDSSEYYSRGKVRDTKEAIKRDVVVSLSRSQVTSSLVRVITHIFAMTVSRIRMTSYSIWVGVGREFKILQINLGWRPSDSPILASVISSLCFLFIYIYIFFLGFNLSRSLIESMIIIIFWKLWIDEI